MSVVDAPTELDARTLLRAGPVFLGTLVVAALVGRPFGNLPSPEQIVRRFEEHRLRVLLGTWLESLAAGLLIAFTAGLRSRLRAAEGQSGPLAMAAFGGGVATSALLLGRAAAVGAAAERAASDGRSPEAGTLAVDTANLLIGKMAPVSLAIVTGSTTIVGRHHGLLPRWLVRAGGALTLGLVSPLNFLAIVPGLMWVAVVGWILGREGTAA